MVWLCAPITSDPEAKGVALKDWKDANLKRASFVTAVLTSANTDELVICLGEVSKRDWIAARKLVAKCLQLKAD